MTGVGTLILSAALAASPAAPPAEAPRWSVGWNGEYCSLSPDTKGASASTFFLRTVPGSDVLDFWLFDPNSTSKSYESTKDVRIELEPGATSYGQQGLWRPVKQGRALVIFDLAKDFASRFVTSNSIKVTRRGTPLYQARLVEPEKAVAALRDCEKGVLRQWGIDAESYFASRPVPRENIPSLFHDSDYPRDAISARQSGMVIARIGVATDGRVSECRPAVSSGHASLDRRTCEIISQRVRFDPARDASGNPTPSTAIARLRWALPTR